jgi:endonuclease-8
MLLKYESRTIYFYSCAIKELEPGWEKEYDWGIDLMSPRWKPARALKALRERPEAQVADILMAQTVFAGLGNIMKNEILFLLRMHPETKLGALSPARRKALVKAAREYAFKFYEWKKANILKRNWKIMRKKTCPNCGGRVSKRITGKLKRWSHYCPRCQVKA